MHGLAQFTAHRHILVIQYTGQPQIWAGVRFLFRQLDAPKTGQPCSGHRCEAGARAALPTTVTPVTSAEAAAADALVTPCFLAVTQLQGSQGTWWLQGVQDMAS